MSRNFISKQLSRSPAKSWRGAALDKPADLAHAYRRLDKVTGVTASDDAPARYGEWIKVAALDFGATADRLASGPFGAIAE